MKRLDQETFVCVDCEMTGLDLVADQIVEVGVIKFTFNEVLEEYETLVNPGRLIPPETIAIHHITDEMVVGKPTIDQVLPQILEMVGSHIIIGHGVKHDISLLALAAERAGIKTNIANNLWMDTLRLARLYGESPINSLEQLRRHFNIEPEGAHRAMSDVIVNMHVFKHLCRRFRNVDEVFEVLSKPIQMKAMPFGPHKGRPFKEIPMEYLIWASNKSFDDDLMFSLRSELKRRKKGNLFSQSSNPFNNL
jgi:DNA polymerase-3 subunit epsilon